MDKGLKEIKEKAELLERCCKNEDLRKIMRERYPDFNGLAFIKSIEEDLLKRVFNDLIESIDHIKPDIILRHGTNNKFGYVSKQALLDYLSKKWEINLE